MEMRNMLRERMKTRLEETGKTAYGAAKEAGLNRYIIHDLMIGKKEQMRIKAIVAVAKVLDCDPEYLAGTQSEVRRQVA